MTLDQLIARGFDLSTSENASAYLRIRCSQCEAVSLNGLPCHETGCPNATNECEECGCDIRKPRRLCDDCGAMIGPFDHL